MHIPFMIKHSKVKGTWAFYISGFGLKVLFIKSTFIVFQNILYEDFYLSACVWTKERPMGGAGGSIHLPHWMKLENFKTNSKNFKFQKFSIHAVPIFFKMKFPHPKGTYWSDRLLNKFDSILRRMSFCAI